MNFVPAIHPPANAGRPTLWFIFENNKILINCENGACFIPDDKNDQRLWHQACPYPFSGLAWRSGLFCRGIGSRRSGPGALCLDGFCGSCWTPSVMICSGSPVWPIISSIGSGPTGFAGVAAIPRRIKPASGPNTARRVVWSIIPV